MILKFKIFLRDCTSVCLVLLYIKCNSVEAWANNRFHAKSTFIVPCFHKYYLEKLGCLGWQELKVTTLHDKVPTFEESAIT